MSTFVLDERVQVYITILLSYAKILENYNKLNEDKLPFEMTDYHMRFQRATEAIKNCFNHDFAKINRPTICWQCDLFNDKSRILIKFYCFVHQSNIILTCTLHINLSCIYFVRKFWSGNGFFSSGIFHCCTKIWSNRKTVVVDTPFGSLLCGRNNIRLQFVIWAIIYSGNIFVVVIYVAYIVLI